MGAVAANHADSVVITSDNPRSESAQDITNDILLGIPEGFKAKTVVELDREKAIRQVLLKAEPDDVILLAGKGHENYQEINGVKQPYSDVSAVRAALELINNKQ